MIQTAGIFPQFQIREFQTRHRGAGGADIAGEKSKVGHKPDFLLDRIVAAIDAVHGIDPDWVEAIAFAWLALARINNLAAGRPSVTSAREAALLGTICTPANS